jgi:hypothetical protein
VRKNSTVRNTSMLLLLISLTALSVFVDNTGSGPLEFGSDPKFHSSEDGACITGIPYSWQEINGFCHWASITMALHCVGVELTLHELLAVSGIGFSMAYVRFNETMILAPGAMFRQPAQFLPVSELYGLTYDMYLDQNAPWTDIFLDAWAAWGVNATPIDGKSEAFSILKDTIDDGYPVVVWTDPYYLPPIDYDIVREYGLKQDPSAPISGHSVLAVGYNDTSETVEVMDPGVGAFGEFFGYPDDGRWSYSVNYTTLDNAWSALGYGVTIVKPGSGIVDEFSTKLGENVVDRLRGERNAYAKGAEDIFFITFGESAFRGLSYDMTVEGIKSYVEQFETPDEQFMVLAVGGFDIEGSLTLQYLAYRSALEALPNLLPDLDLDPFLEAGRTALSYMAELSQNGTLTDIFIIENYDSLLTNTFMGIALDFQESGDLDTALDAYSEDIAQIAEHLLAIADAWDSAANALETAISSNPLDSPFLAIVGIGVVVIVIVIVARRR